MNIISEKSRTGSSSFLFFNVIWFISLISYSHSQQILVPLLEVSGKNVWDSTARWGETLGGDIVGIGDVNSDSIPDYIVTGNIYKSKLRQMKFYLGSKGTLKDTVYRTLPSGPLILKGDLNGDGKIDIVTSTAPYPEGIHPDSLYVYFGNESKIFPFDTVAIKIPGGLNEALGNELAIGDFNGDGKQDILASISRNKYGGDGGFRIFFGRDTLRSIADISIDSTAPGEWYSQNFTAGDFNGDGCDDIICSWINITEKPPATYISIYFGAKNFNPSRNSPNILVSSKDWSWLKGNANDSPIYPKLLDINGDGIDDLIIWLPDSDYTTSMKGHIYYFFGKPNIKELVPDFVLADQPTTNFNSWTGGHINDIGDVNSDGYIDILTEGSTSGMAYSVFVYLGGKKLSHYPSALRTKPIVPVYGYRAAGLGDVNQDGINDFGVCAPYDDNSSFGTQRGYFAIYSGDPLMVLSIPKDSLQNSKIDNFNLLSPYPNPFNQLISFPILINEPTEITFELFNILGKRVKTSREDFNYPGKYYFNLDEEDGAKVNLQAGTYFVKVSDSKSQQIRKIILLR